MAAICNFNYRNCLLAAQSLAFRSRHFIIVFCVRFYYAIESMGWGFLPSTPHLKQVRTVCLFLYQQFWHAGLMPAFISLLHHFDFIVTANKSSHRWFWTFKTTNSIASNMKAINWMGYYLIFNYNWKYYYFYAYHLGVCIFISELIGCNNLFVLLFYLSFLFSFTPNKR